ncbi:hypothetical protein HMSSN036_62180 [Paenibacillus macerans]|nr:hypothetical protein HMSSN036_62180 [Paenibacillus macerans]
MSELRQRHDVDSETGMLACPSCGRKDDIEQIPDPLKQQVFSEDEVREYHCESCGAVIVTEPETSATTCSFAAPPWCSATA